MKSRNRFLALVAVLALTVTVHANDEFSLAISLWNGGTIYSDALQPFIDEPGTLDSYSDGVGAIVLAYPDVCFDFGAPETIHDAALWDEYKHLVPTSGSLCQAAKFRTGAGELWATEIETSGLVAGSFTFFPEDVQLELRWGYAESWTEFAPKLLVTKNSGDPDDGCFGVSSDCWSVVPDPATADPWELDWSGEMATLFVFVPKGGNRGRHALATFSMPFELVAIRAEDNQRAGSGSGGGKGGGKGGKGGL